MSDMHDPYEDQLAAARYRAERDQARQELARLRGEATTMSAYDLLPDEELETLWWVREHGGLDSVRKLLDWVVGHCSTERQLDFDFWLSGRVMYELGFDEDMADRDEVERRLRDRLMPKGMEWPRFEDNEPVAFGDYAEIGDCIGPIVSVTIRSADNTSLEKPAYDIAVLRSGFVNHSPIEPFSVRVKRPAVISADGEPLHERETVWGTKGGRYHLTSVHDGEVFARHVGGSFGAEVESAGGSGLYRLRADRLTHQRPVLDADGVPVREGETVYANGNARGNGTAWRVLRIDPGISHPLYCGREDGKPGVARGLKSEWVTHKRPAPKVLDADGTEIRVGDEVWDVETGCKRTVRAVNDNETVEFDGYENRGWFSKFLTHRAPILAADGKPLREGETVWSVDSGIRYTVEKITDELIPIKCHSEMGYMVSLCPSQLTHTKPEQPDTYAKLYDDVHDERCGSEEFVRRCRALAERSE